MEQTGFGFGGNGIDEVRRKGGMSALDIGDDWQIEDQIDIAGCDEVVANRLNGDAGETRQRVAIGLDK